MRAVPIYQDPQYAASFAPQVNMSVALSAEATQMLIEHRTPKRRKAMYLLFTYDGHPYHDLPVEVDWDRVKRRAIEEQMIIYNSSTRRAFRAAWRLSVDDRTDTNFFWEPVKLFAHAPTVKGAKIPDNVVLVRN